MKALRRILLASPALLAACGGGGSPTAPGNPGAGATPPPVTLHDLSVVVFYDEDGNGVLDPTEAVRLPGVTVTASSHAATTGAGGTATLQVPAGSQTVTVQTSSLPPFYQAGQGVAADVPQTTRILIPVTLPIGSNRPNTYMGFGDSITVGEGSSDEEGYRPILQQALQAHLGAGQVIDEGVSATRSNRGADRIEESLRRRHPAFTLVHYGTNDWNDSACRNISPCFTIDSLRAIVREAKFYQSMPVLATILPTNVGYDGRTPPERNEWVAEQDRLIREMAAQEGALLVDLEKEFLKQPELSDLFFDHVHPNDAGYEIVARTFFLALVQPRGAAATGLREAANAAAPGPSARLEGTAAGVPELTFAPHARAAARPRSTPVASW